MTIEEIRKNAPDGATDYREYTNQYFMIKGDSWNVWDGMFWRKWQSSRFINLKPL